MLRRHLDEYGSTPDGRLFRGARGGILSESVYGRAWHAARQAALGPDLAATALARRPYDLRYAALSLWLNASREPAEVAARAGASTRILHDVYVHCVSGRDDTVSRRTQDALDPGASAPRSSPCGKATSGYTHRRHHPSARYLYVNRSPVPRTARGRRVRQARNTAHRRSPSVVFPAGQMASDGISAEAGRRPIRPAHSLRSTADGSRNRSLCAQKPVTQS